MSEEDATNTPRQDSDRAKHVANQVPTDGGSTARTAFQRKEQTKAGTLPKDKGPKPEDVSSN